MAKLHAFATSPDPVLGIVAERALLRIERERILAGTPPIGPRLLPPRVKTETEDLLGNSGSNMTRPQRLDESPNSGYAEPE